MIYFGKSCEQCGVIKRKKMMHRILRLVEHSGGPGYPSTSRHVYWYCDDCVPPYDVIRERDAGGGGDMYRRFFKYVPYEQRVREDGSDWVRPRAMRG